jgi:N-methylhydantoinase B/oxoprolinase/acetone carboxylase alpha subunit
MASKRARRPAKKRAKAPNLPSYLPEEIASALEPGEAVTVITPTAGGYGAVPS